MTDMTHDSTPEISTVPNLLAANRRTDMYFIDKFVPRKHL
jgi:hypothetical protein